MSNKDCFCPFDEDLAREIFKKKDKQTRQLKAKLEKIEEAITTCLTFHTCQKCKFYKECEMGLEEFILEIIQGE